MTPKQEITGLDFFNKIIKDLYFDEIDIMTECIKEYVDALNKKYMGTKCLLKNYHDLSLQQYNWQDRNYVFVSFELNHFEGSSYIDISCRVLSGVYSGSYSINDVMLTGEYIND